MASAIPVTAGAADCDALLRRYRQVRSASEHLIEPLAPEDCVVQTMPEVSPTKWHLAHVTWFFETFLLREFDRTYVAFDERFHYLFNSYYYTAGEMHARTRRGLLSRPLLGEVLDYRAHVDAAMAALIAARGDDAGIAFRIELGLHHEQQHQELLLTDIKHVFFTNPLAPAYRDTPQPRTGTAAALGYVERPGGLLRIGAESDSGFCFDNETPRHDVLVGAHTLGDRLVTNGEFRAFIDDGGYRDARHWLSDGWALVLDGSIERPWYWAPELDREFTLGGWRDIDPAAPVCHVSYYEADAYARWAGARLPLEAELELAAAGTEIAGNLLDGGLLHPAPAGSAGDGVEAHGLTQLWGDVWEWTASPYGPYPGFRPLDGSLGEYNGKFMSSQMVVRGGSCATWADHMRPTYRSFFYPRDRWQFLGFRLAKDA